MDAVRTALLRSVSHDLRTPLTSMQIALEYAADQVDDPAVRDALAGALRDAVYLSALIYNLRPYEANRISIAPEDLPLDTTIARA